MFPHYCGNVFHDLIVNAVMLLVSYPDWMPFSVAIHHLANKVKRRHDHN
jgi:hypothetical protein